MVCDLVPHIIKEDGTEVPSILYPKLLSQFGRKLANRIYQWLHSYQFIDRFGDWTINEGKGSIDKNGEPELNDDNTFSIKLEDDSIQVISIPTEKELPSFNQALENSFKEVEVNPSAEAPFTPNLWAMGTQTETEPTLRQAEIASGERSTILGDEFDPENDKASLQRKRKIIEEAINTIRRRIKEFMNDPSPKAKKGVQALNEQREDLITLLRQNKIDESIVHFITTTHDSISILHKRLYDKINDGTLTLGELHQIYKYAQGYEIVTDIRREIERDPRLSNRFESDGLQLLDEIQSKLKVIQTEYVAQSKKLVALKFAKFDTRTEKIFQNQIEKDYVLAHTTDLTPTQRNGWIKEHRQEILNHVDQQMQNRAEEIESKKVNNLIKELEFSSSDIGTLEHWITSMQHVSDYVLNLTHTLIYRQKDKVRRDFNLFETELGQRHLTFVEYQRQKGVNVSLMDRLYNDMLERDRETGELTGNMIDEYYSGFWTELQNFFEGIAEDKTLDLEAKKIKRGNWFKENTIANPNWIAMRKEVIKIAKESGKEAAQAYATQWKLDNPNENKFLPSEKWRNKAYNRLVVPDGGKATPVQEFYWFLRNAQERFDSLRPEGKVLGTRLPAIRKGTIERLYTFEKGIGKGISTMGEAIKGAFVRKADDTEFGEDAVYVQEGLDRQIKKYIPIRFTGQIVYGDTKSGPGSIHVNDLSLDLASSVAANAYTTLNYAYMNRILPEIEALKVLLSEREVIDKTGKTTKLFRRIVDKITDGKVKEEKEIKAATNKGVQNKAFTLFKSFVDDKIYGEEFVAQDFAKTAGTLGSYVSTTFLSANIMAGTMNVVNGHIQFIVEAAGGRYIDRHGWGQAEKRLTADMPDILKDVGSTVRHSMTNLLSDSFDAVNDFSRNRHTYAANNIFKKHLSQSTLHFLNNIGEFFMQHQTMYAVLNKIKVKGENGEYITLKGTSKNAEEGLSLLDMYNKDGSKLILDSRVKAVVFDGRTYTWNEDTKYLITNRIRHINERLHGAYSHQNRPEFQRYWAGRLVMMMRKWIEPGMRRRWNGGLLQALKGEETVKYDLQLGDFEEGTYITTIKFFRNLITDLTKMQFHWISQFSQMNEMERANVRKALVEVGIFMGAFIVGKFFLGKAEDSDDEEEEYWNNLAAYFSYRLYTELSFFVNPVEALKIIQDPAPSLSFIETLIRAIKHAVTQERYVQGRREGQLKLQRDIERLTPWFRHYDRLQHPEEMLDFFQFNK